jgi:uncharacterized DUF497 family protein
MPFSFTWDARKATTIRRRHGVTFEEAMTVLLDPLALLTEDTGSQGRGLLLGLSGRMRLLLVVHAELGEDRIRLISARRATAHERRSYEEGA